MGGTLGNVDDRSVLKTLMKNLQGKCYADKAYISKELFHILWKKDLHFVTRIRSNMKNYLMPFIDRMLLRKRFLIEIVLSRNAFILGLLVL
jgi:hypothetical protein